MNMTDKYLNIKKFCINKNSVKWQTKLFIFIYIMHQQLLLSSVYFAS